MMYCTVRGPAPKPPPSVTMIHGEDDQARQPDTALVFTSIEPEPPPIGYNADAGVALSAVMTRRAMRPRCKYLQRRVPIASEGQSPFRPR